MGASISVTITQNSQSIDNNTSNVTVKATLSWTYGTYNNNKMYGELYIDGVAYGFTANFNWNGASSSGSVVLLTKTVNVTHSADGTKTLNCSASFEYHSGKWVEGYASKTLTTIPRATTPTVSGTLSLGSSITISTAGRASSNFTHNLYYSWGSQIIDSLIASGVTTSKTWIIPKTLAEYIQGGTSGTMFLKCVTYNGSTVIGTKTLTLTITVPDTAEFQPTIKSISAENATELPVELYIVGKSQLKITVSAVGGNVSGSGNRNSYPVSATVTVEGVKYNVTLGPNDPQTWSVTTNTLKNSGAQDVLVTVKDSRGRSVSKSFAYTAMEYALPQITSFTAERCLSDGTLNDSGTYILIGLKTTVASVDNTNAKTYKIVYENNGAEVTLLSGTLAQYVDNVISYNTYSKGITFSVDYAWPIRVYVYDSYNTNVPSVATVIVPTEGTFMDWRDNGKGISFGGVSTRDGFQCGWNMYDKYDTFIGNGLALYTGSGDNAIDANETVENLIVTDKNTPTAAFYYVVTYFYSTKTSTSNKAQTAVPYNASGDGIYSRYMVGGIWSAWKKPSNLLDAYPVNSIYISYSHTSPAELFGGTWTRIESRFLWGTPSTGTIGATAGASTHTLTENEMPNHTHEFQYSTNGGSGWSRAIMGRDGRFEGANYLGATNVVDEFVNFQVRISSTGGGAAHNNMPPYVNVAIWRRTA